jgi:hypothetical protein
VRLRRLGDLRLDLDRDLLRLDRERLCSDGERDRDRLPLDLDVRDILHKQGINITTIAWDWFLIFPVYTISKIRRSKNFSLQPKLLM